MDIQFLNRDGYTEAMYEDIRAYNGAFGNCQNFAVNNFQGLLWDHHSEAIQDTNNFLVKVGNEFGKSFAVIDITVSTYELLKEIINDKKLNVSFIVNTPYVNRNDNDMVLCILDISKLELIK